MGGLYSFLQIVESSVVILRNGFFSIFSTVFYLGLGLMSAREHMLDGPHEGDSREVASNCHASGFSEKWDNARSGYTISGTGSDFSQCYAKAKSVMSKMNVDSPQEIRGQTFYAFSYYFDRALEVGLIGEKGGEVTEVENGQLIYVKEF